MPYTLTDKKAIMTRINNLKHKKHYIEIYEHKNARPIQLIGSRKVYHHTVNK